jgi:HEAT repeat protein
MNDARVDTPAPGPSSSVEAYEEDWYRSLRALAERRATEFDDVGEVQQAEDASPERISGETPSAGVDETHDGEAASGEDDTPSPWAAPSLFDRPRSTEPLDAPHPDPWVTSTAPSAETTAETAADGEHAATETGVGLASSGAEANEPIVADRDAQPELRDEATDDEGDLETSGADEAQQRSSPWARVLRPLERIQLSPLGDPTIEGNATGAEQTDRTESAPSDVEPPSAAIGVDDHEPEQPADASADAEPELSVPDFPARFADDAIEPSGRTDAPTEMVAEALDEHAAQASDETDEVAAIGEAEPDVEIGTPAEPFVPADEQVDEHADAVDVPAIEIDIETASAAAAAEDVQLADEDVIDTDAVTVTAEDEASPRADAGSELALDADVPEAEPDPAKAGGSTEPEVRDVEGAVDPEVSEVEGAVEVDAGVARVEAEVVDPEADRAPDVETGSGSGPEPESAVDNQPEPQPAGPSLTSRDPVERKTALVALEEREPTAAELDTVAALILDPDADIRRMAVETLSRTPARLDDAVVRQALQDPADEVRAAAVRAAASRGIRDLPTLAPLVDARRSPETHRTVLELLPKILGEAQLTAEALDPLLLAIAQMQPPPDEAERAAFSEIAASIGTTLLIEGLMLPDARRLGAVRLLAGDRSHAVLHALADRAGDPLEEVRQAGVAAADEIGRIEAEAARAAGPPDIGALADDLRNPDPEHVERALTTLSEVDRADVVAWCRERLGHGDAESVATVASLAAVLDLNEIGVELLTRGASLPSERRRPVVEALAEFPDPSQLAGFLAVVPSDKRADAARLVWEASGRRILPDLRGLLADPAVEVRVAVIDIAGDADDPASIEAVAGLLATDASPEVRAAAVRTISRSEGALPSVIRALGDPDPHVRATAVESMPSSPASEVGPVLAQALTDLDERVRLAAIERLAGVSSAEPALAWSALRQCRLEERDELLGAFQRTNPNQVLEIALEHLYSPDQDERKLAVEMTGWGANQAAVESAIRALGDPVPDVRRAAVGALGRLRDRSAVAALGKTLADPDPDVRVGAVRALGVIDDEGVLAFLVAALKDPDHRVRETPRHVLTEWSSPAVAKRLAGVLAVPSLRDSAADLLRRIGPTSVELLIDVLIQGSPEIRYTVGPLLEQIIGIEEFLGRMDSLEPERRLRAIEALGAIAGPLAVDALMRSLSDPDERIRLRATQLLGELGDPIAAESVRRLVDDPVPDVAAAARHALETNLDSRASERPAEYS